MLVLRRDSIINNPKERDTVFIGIELGEKDEKPENAFDIDHHNFNSDKPSSLEQIVDFINENKLTKEPVKLTRKQTLIAFICYHFLTLDVS